MLRFTQLLLFASAMQTQLIKIILLGYIVNTVSSTVSKKHLDTDEKCTVIESGAKPKSSDYFRKGTAIIKVHGWFSPGRETIIFHVLSYQNLSQKERPQSTQENVSHDLESLTSDPSHGLGDDKESHTDTESDVRSFSHGRASSARLSRSRSTPELQQPTNGKSNSRRFYRRRPEPTAENDEPQIKSPVDMDKIRLEMLNTDNQISFNKHDNNYVRPSMENVIKKIQLDHEVRIIAHGWTDSLDSLHLIFRYEWPVVVAGEWRYYENEIGKNVHVIFVNYQGKARTNYHWVAASKELHEVAETILVLLDKIYDHYVHLYIEKNKSADGVLSFDEYMKHRVQAAGHSLGGQILGALGHKMALPIREKRAGKLGILYGLDAAGIKFDKREDDQTDLNEFFHLDRRHGHRVILLLTEWQGRGNKYAEGHYNFYVNGPIDGFEQVQPGCRKAHDQVPMSCSHQRAINIFRAALEVQREGDYDHLFVGMKYVRDESIKPETPIEDAVQVDDAASAMTKSSASEEPPIKYPKESDNFILTTEKLIFGLNQKFDLAAVPAAEAEPEIYFILTALCSPFNVIENKMDKSLPQGCTEWIDNQNPHGELIEMKFYVFHSYAPSNLKWKISLPMDRKLIVANKT